MKANDYAKSQSFDIDAELAALHARRGDVCLMPIPFTDDSGVKTRPVIVIGEQGSNLIVAPMTTHAPRNRFDIEFAPSTDSGLRKHGTIQCSQITFVSRTLVSRVLGQVTTQELQLVVEAMTRWFQRVVVSP